MKKVRILFLLLFSYSISYAQTNTFPSSGNVGIGTVSPFSTLNINGGIGSLTTGLTFGDGNTGFYESADNTLTTTIGGTNTFYWAGNLFRGATTSSPALMHEVASAINPTLVPSNSDQDTGIGWSSTNQLSLITGGSEALRIDSNGNIGIGTILPSEELEIHVGDSFGETLISSERDGNGETLGRIGFEGRNSSSTEIKYSGVKGGISSNSSSNPIGTLYFETIDGAGSFGNRMTINGSNVGIGTTDPKSKLAVEGQIRATEVKVLADISVPDYVFEPDYKLRTLEEIKEYITENKHLPEIPSAIEIADNGIDLGDMNMRLLKKIEELTLYLIEQNERNQAQQTEIDVLKAKITQLEKK